MGMWLYLVVLLNGKMVQFLGDEVELEEGTYRFFLDGEIIGEFKKDNIAGYFMQEMEEIDDEDY